MCQRLCCCHSIKLPINCRIDLQIPENVTNVNQKLTMQIYSLLFAIFLERRKYTNN